MKTILTLVGGGERDDVILRTALAAAMPLSAHLDCLHAHVPSGQAARHANLDYAMGEAVKNALGNRGQGVNLGNFGSTAEGAEE